MVSLTPFSGSNPLKLPIQNRFAPIENTSSSSQTSPQMSYSQLIQKPVVCSPTTPSKKETLVSLGSTKFVTNTPKPSTSSNQYIRNPNEQFVSILEEEEVCLLKQSFQSLIEFMFPKESLYFGCKPRTYYEAILIDTGSVNITHVRNQNSNRPIDYSKFQIFRILSLSDWQSKPHTNKTLSNYPQNPMFNYYDYKDAWYNVFYLRCYSHSWFVFFDKNFDFNHGYPTWMIKWFKYMGNILDVFPIPIQEGFKKFQELFPQEIPSYEYLLQFTILFKIPWIISWKFIVKEEREDGSLPLSRLYRIVSVKWWDKLPQDQVSKMTIQGVVNYFTESKGFGVSSSLNPPPSGLSTQDEEEELRLLMSAPTKEELRQLIKEIKKNAAQSSPTSSVENVPNLFQDSQDPYTEFSPYD